MWLEKFLMSIVSGQTSEWSPKFNMISPFSCQKNHPLASHLHLVLARDFSTAPAYPKERLPIFNHLQSCSKSIEKLPCESKNGCAMVIICTVGCKLQSKTPPVHPPTVVVLEHPFPPARHISLESIGHDFFGGHVMFQKFLLYWTPWNCQMVKMCW